MEKEGQNPTKQPPSKASEISKLRIFLSYGHDEHADLAKKIKSDLEQRGHKVWFDEEKLRVGTSWEEYIERGIEWASADQKNGRILLLMTPHSVRRPDGYCLNELAFALDHHLRVVPIMVAQVEPPLSICRIQWLDLEDCVPVQEKQTRYDDKFVQLAQALEKNTLDVEGVQSGVRTALNPLSYSADISQHLPRFTGRKWLFEKINAWLKDADGDKVFWLTGDPGTGKTAISSKLSSGCPAIAAFHICRYGDRLKADPQRAVLSITWQLATQIPDLMKKLNRIKNLEEICQLSDAATIFERLVVDPLQNNVQQPEHPCVILIDGLDEATVDDRNELCEFLASEMERTPDWVRFLLTSRQEPEVTQPLQAYSPTHLDHDSKENRDDIKSYLYSQLAPFEQNSKVLEAAVNHITEQNECVFLYAEQIRSALEKKTLTMSQIGDFPRGLGGIYLNFFKRRFKDIRGYKNNHRPALSVVAAAACEPIPMKLLMEAFNWDEYQVEEIPEEWGSLFPVVDEKVKPFHRSVADWITDKRKAGPYLVKSTETSHSGQHWVERV